MPAILGILRLSSYLIHFFSIIRYKGHTLNHAPVKQATPLATLLARFA